MEMTMTKITALLVCSLALVAATPALAQDYGDENNDLPDTPADVFSGPHIELSAGLDHLGIKSYKDIDATADLSAKKTSLSYGGAIGYDVPLTERLTLGGEFGLYTSSNNWTNPALVTGKFNTARVRAGRDLSFGVRLGYAFTTKTQVFGKIAYTNTRFGVTGTDGSGTLYDGISAAGARAGVGVEHHLTRWVYVKAEFDHSQYGSGSFNYNGTVPDASNFDLHNSRDQLMGSVGFRF
jgi:outer membrane immunogenic protein